MFQIIWHILNISKIPNHLLIFKYISVCLAYSKYYYYTQSPLHLQKCFICLAYTKYYNNTHVTHVTTKEFRRGHAKGRLPIVKNILFITTVIYKAILHKENWVNSRHRKGASR